MAATDLVQQIRVFTAVHWASEHSIEPAVEVPGFLLELPAEGEVLVLGGGAPTAAIGQGARQRLSAAASALRSSAQFVRLALAMVRPDGIARDVVPQAAGGGALTTGSGLLLARLTNSASWVLVSGMSALPWHVLLPPASPLVAIPASCSLLCWVLRLRPTRRCLVRCRLAC